MFKKPIWSAIETTLFYYSGNMYNRASLHTTKPPAIEGSNGQTLNKKYIKTCWGSSFHLSFGINSPHY